MLNTITKNIQTIFTNNNKIIIESSNQESYNTIIFTVSGSSQKYKATITQVKN